MYGPTKALADGLCPNVAITTGITQVKFSEFVLASWAGMLPGTFAYVYLGSLGRLAIDAAAGGAAAGDGSQGTADLVKYVLYGKCSLRRRGRGWEQSLLLQIILKCLTAVLWAFYLILVAWFRKQQLYLVFCNAQ